jgi:hypothetical protein
MAVIEGNLWEYNLAKVVVLDVTDDYRLMKPPLPSDCYPVLAEMMVPRAMLAGRIADMRLVEGYLYDWHEVTDDSQLWYVAVVDALIVQQPVGAGSA